jgi:hypothetical protein
MQVAKAQMSLENEILIFDAWREEAVKLGLQCAALQLTAEVAARKQALQRKEQQAAR